jgi:hypothetical protein
MALSVHLSRGSEHEPARPFARGRGLSGGYTWEMVNLVQDQRELRTRFQAHAGRKPEGEPRRGDRVIRTR